MYKKIIAAALMLALFATLAGCGGSAVVPKKVKAGDIITFGEYEQDSKTSNGKEAIEWVVLDVEEDRVLLVSRYVLDCMPYNEEDEEVTWETCALREWLNEDFYEEAFSESERKQIQETQVSNKDNAFYGTPGGNNTRDFLFCLSVEDVEKYYDFYGYYDIYLAAFSEELITEATEYAKGKGVDTNEITNELYKRENRLAYDKTLDEIGYSKDCIGLEGAYWWLRSPADLGRNKCTVNAFGGAGARDGRYICYSRVGVRPALYVSR